MNLNQAINKVYESYDSMFKNDTLKLSSLDSFLDIAAYYGDSQSWNVYNMLLLLGQAPEFRNLMFEKDMLDRRVYIKPGSKPVSLIAQSSETSKYEVFEMFDLTQSTAAEQAKYEILTSDSKTTLIALVTSLKTINWEIDHYTASSVPWKDWARVSNPDPECKVGYIAFRDPTEQEKATMPQDAIYTCMCRDIWKSFALWNLFYKDEFRSSKDFPMKYLPLCELYADLMCTRYKLSSHHDFTHIPKALQGLKCDLKSFRQTFDPVLVLMSESCETMDWWMDYFVNPKEPVDVTVQREGSDAS